MTYRYEYRKGATQDEKVAVVLELAKIAAQLLHGPNTTRERRTLRRRRARLLRSVGTRHGELIAVWLDGVMMEAHRSDSVWTGIDADSVCEVHLTPNKKQRTNNGRESHEMWTYDVKVLGPKSPAERPAP